jgi:F-type H+-transporting ATPase subunit b
MDEILHQLAGLFIGSIPTIILFLLTLIVYRILVYSPLTKALAQRRERTAGAIEQARLSIAAAEAKAQEYEAKIRAARMEIFKAREERMAAWNHDREIALENAREATQRKVSEAKATLESEVEAARTSIQNSAEELANDVLRAVLPAGFATAGSSR